MTAFEHTVGSQKFAVHNGTLFCNGAFVASVPRGAPIDAQSRHIAVNGVVVWLHPDVSVDTPEYKAVLAAAKSKNTSAKKTAAKTRGPKGTTKAAKAPAAKKTPTGKKKRTREEIALESAQKKAQKSMLALQKIQKDMKAKMTALEKKKKKVVAKKSK